MMDVELPAYLTPCDPSNVFFPSEWKEAYFRRHLDPQTGVYTCPRCHQHFSGIAGFRRLQGDHIMPRSRGGLTVWSNMMLLCSTCNIEKSNRIP